MLEASAGSLATLNIQTFMGQVLSSFLPDGGTGSGQDLSLPMPEPTRNQMSPPAGLITPICHGPSSWKSYAIVSSQHSSPCGGPLLLNDLLLLAEFLWLQILFESLCSAQLVSFSYRGNQQMGVFDKGQWGGCLSGKGRETK